jgi:NAD(P) transhydrogenase subunit alpha
MFPLMMTAAGTIKPAKVFVIGAGVAGLQAIGMAKKMMGAVVHAYDIRPAVKEQIESLGGKFVELPIEAGQSETKGGYAKAMDEEFYRKQRELMGKVVAESDVVITTAAVPGKKAPILVTREMVEKMHPGSVVIDLAAERGGNCDATVPGEWVEVGGARIYGPLNLPSTIPYHASQMYSTNVTNFLLNLYKKPEEGMDVKDQIVAETMSTRDGEIVNAMIREKAGLPALNTAPAAPEEKKA